MKARTKQGGMMRIDIATGTLDLDIDRADMPIDDLCGFAARDNAKRGFLFVSKVLGKHIPVTPSRMEAVHAGLAAMADSAIGGRPALFLAMAETAVGLGSGVFEQSAVPEKLFMHTTRCNLSRPLAFGFSEEHCHASEHRLYAPGTKDSGALFREAKVLVLVDDEMSTGNTLCNLANEYKKINPGLETVVVVTLTNWLDGEATARLAGRMPAEVVFADLLSGSFRFTRSSAKTPSLRAVSVPVGKQCPQDSILGVHTGRTGVFDVGGTPIDEALSVARQTHLDGKVLVLGTGEFLHRPYTLARSLEEAGFDVSFQSTTRSPILVGGDIHCALRFKDNYFEDIDNFLYNVPERSYDRVLVCYETNGHPSAHGLPGMIGGCHRVFCRKDGSWKVSS